MHPVTPPATADIAPVVSALFEGVLRGLGHTLGNRVTAIAGLAGTIRPGEPAEPALVRALADEAARLGMLLRLQRLVAGAAGAGEEAIHLPDFLPDVVALHGQHAGARDLELRLEGDPAVLPVRVPPTALVRALLVLVAAVAERARDAAGATLVLRYGGDAITTTCTVEGRRPGAEATGASGGEDASLGAHARAAAWMLGGTGVEVREAALANGIALELRLPTLLEVRRRERLERTAAR